MTLQEKVVTAFHEKFGEMPAYLVRSPGRVNLIGEHTDYNEGFVLPLAIDRAIWLAVRPRYDRQVHLYLPKLGESASFHIDQFEKGMGWLEYIKGMVWVLKENWFRVHGWEGVLLSDLPIGAGLSSSAALTLAVARVFSLVAYWEWEASRMASLAQRVETEWIGVQCGMMDQLVVSAGKKDHALLLDCRSHQFAPVPIPPDWAIVILDTHTRRELANSAYNERRVQCEEAARVLGVPALRDITVDQFQTQSHLLDNVLQRRARHVISENDRTLQASQALRRGNVEKLGALMHASHVSLRDDFEVSSEALNVMVDYAQAHEACYGARMTGAGFGGCAIAIVQRADAGMFTRQINQQYQTHMGLKPSLYVCQASDGVNVVSLS